MASHFDDLVRQGLVGVKSKRFGTWKRRWIVLRTYSSAGPTRIEVFTEKQAFHNLCASSSIHPIRVWPLINVAGVTQGNSRPNPRKRKVTVCFADNTFDQFKFRTNSAHEAEQWRRDIEEVSSMVYSDVRFTDDVAPGFHSIDQTECFRVFLQPSPLLSFGGECHMEVTSSHVIVTDHLHRQVVTWDIDTIRRFGSDDRLLTIETGRSSSTGEAFFVFRSFEAQRIERHLNAVTFALSTAVRVIETDVNRGPLVPSRPSPYGGMQCSRQQRQQRFNQSVETDGHLYMQHARSEPGSSAGLFAFSDSPEAYRRPSAPDPYPRTTGTRSPPAVTNRRDIFPMYFAAGVDAAAGARGAGPRRPSTPVFFSNLSPPLSAPPFRFSQDSLSQDDDSSDDLETPPILQDRSRDRLLASSNDISLSQAQIRLASYAETPPPPHVHDVLPPQRTRHRLLSSYNNFVYLPQHHHHHHQPQQQQQDRLPEVTSVPPPPPPPRPTRTAFISTSSCPSPSSPSHHCSGHSSRRRPPPPPPPPRVSHDLPLHHPPLPPPPPIPPRLAIHSTSWSNSSNNV